MFIYVIFQIPFDSLPYLECLYPYETYTCRDLK